MQRSIKRGPGPIRVGTEVLFLLARMTLVPPTRLAGAPLNFIPIPPAALAGSPPVGAGQEVGSAAQEGVVVAVVQEAVVEADIEAVKVLFVA